MLVLSATVDQWLRCSATDPKVAGSIPAAAVALRWKRNGGGPCTVQCRCTLKNTRLKNTRWSKCPELSTTVSFIIISWFWGVKLQIWLL
uniref:Uncharacterized protein n=1 Tax=Rhipicephalus zambeziensis TaxID=60191 RepID=A0A224YZS5_9ACAR